MATGYARPGHPGHGRQADNIHVGDSMTGQIWVRSRLRRLRDRLEAVGHPVRSPRMPAHLADFHTQAATGPGIDEYGSSASVRANWSENLVQTTPFIRRTVHS